MPEALRSYLFRLFCHHLSPACFRDGFFFKVHRRVYHSTLALRVMKKKKQFCKQSSADERGGNVLHAFKDVRAKKWLDPRLESGLDWLLCSKFARQRELSRSGRCPPARWILRVSLPRNSEGYDTRFAPHQALKTVARGKLNFDEMMVLRRVDMLP